MARPDTICKSIKTALKESGRLPDATSYSTYELDTEGGQSNVRPPVVEITVISSARSRPHNTDLSGYVTDDDGNRIGKIFNALFEMTVQIDVWTAEGDKFDPYDIGQSIRTALYQYDDHMVGDCLPDPDDPTTDLERIDRFSVNEGSVENDLSMTPALRRWRQTAEIWFSEQVRTDDTSVSVINTPSAGSATSDPDSQQVVLNN